MSGKPPARSFPQSVGPLDRLGATLPKHRWVDLFAAFAEIERDRKRARREYWTYPEYDRIFALVMAGDAKGLIFVLRPLVSIRARYLKARAAGLSPFQFYLSEVRHRDDCEARDARQAREHFDAQERSRQKAYRAMVAENELKERARQEARENVERERGPRKPSVARNTQGTAIVPTVRHDPHDPDHEYIPPDPF